MPTVACFQSPSATIDFRPTRFVTIDGFTGTKLDLLKSFRSQAGIRTYLQDDFVLATARYWSRYASGGQYCEPLELIRDAGAVVGATSTSTSQPSGNPASSTPSESYGV